MVDHQVVQVAVLVIMVKVSSPGSNAHPGGTDVESPPAGWGGSGEIQTPTPGPQQQWIWW